MIVQPKLSSSLSENTSVAILPNILGKSLESSVLSDCSERSPAEELQPETSRSANPSRIVAITALVIALMAISFSAVLVRFSEQELSPYATAFNRFWITVVVLSGWCGVRQILKRLPSYESMQLNKRGNSSIPVEETNATQPITVSCTHACETFTPMVQDEKTVSLNDKPLSPFRLDWIGWPLLAVGVFFTADLVLWSWSLTCTSIANATLLASLTPVFTCLGGWIFWGKSFEKRLLAGMAIAISGIVLIGLSDLQVEAKLWGDAVSLLAAVSFALYLLVMERLQTRLSTTNILLWSSAIAACITFPIALLGGGPLFPISVQGWVSVGSLALICQILGQALLVFSLNHLACELVAIFLLFDPLLAALGGRIFFSETLSLLTWLAFAVVSIGIYLASSSQGTVKVDEAEASPNFAVVHNVDG